MSKIDSRPSRTKAWEYVFFVELGGHIEDQPVQTALAELEDLCVYIKILGSYPCGL
jgi:chorismate mutase/prephenate dehydratase